jgi:hypothetical protein
MLWLQYKEEIDMGYEEIRAKLIKEYDGNIATPVYTLTVEDVINTIAYRCSEGYANENKINLEECINNVMENLDIPYQDYIHAAVAAKLVQEEEV